jgi:hypothetical protein
MRQSELVNDCFRAVFFVIRPPFSCTYRNSAYAQQENEAIFNKSSSNILNLSHYQCLYLLIAPYLYYFQ